MFRDRRVDMGGRGGGRRGDKKALVERARREREHRKNRVAREAAAVEIQRIWRGALSRRRAIVAAVDRYSGLISTLRLQKALSSSAGLVPADAPGNGHLYQLACAVLYLDHPLRSAFAQKLRPRASKTRQARLLTLCAFIIARLKTPGNYFRSGLAGGALGLSARTWFAQVPRLVLAAAREAAEVRCAAKPAALFLRLMATAADPTMTAILGGGVSVPSAYIVGLARALSKAYAPSDPRSRESVPVFLGRLLTRARGQGGPLASAALVVSFRCFWVDALSGDKTQRCTKAVIQHTLTAPGACATLSRPVKAAATKMGVWAPLLQCLRRMDSQGTLRALTEDGISAPPIAFLLGNLVSLCTAVGRGDSGGALDLDECVNEMMLFELLFRMCPEKRVLPLLESAGRDGKGVAGALGGQLDLLFRDFHDVRNILSRPVWAVVGARAARDYKYSPSDPARCAIDRKLTETASCFAKNHPRFAHHACGLYQALLSQWPGRRSQLLTGLCFATPSLCVFLAHLELQLSPLNPKVSMQAGGKGAAGSAPSQDAKSKPRSRGGAFAFFRSLFGRSGAGVRVGEWSKGVGPTGDGPSGGLFQLFCALYGTAILSLDMHEFTKSGSPFWSHDALAAFVKVVKSITFEALWAHRCRLRWPLRLLRQLHQRQVRAPFCDTQVWEVSSSGSHHAREFERAWARWTRGSGSGAEGPDAGGVLACMPFALSFEARARALRSVLNVDKASAAAGQGRVRTVNVRRTHVVVDGYQAFLAMGEGLRDRVAVRFIDRDGKAEMGIDMGGPFKEFLEVLCKEVFREDYGLFAKTPQGHYYPSPNAHLVPQWREHLRFVGSVLGKALYEGHLVEVRFASFFLVALTGARPYFHDLQELDAQLHRNLVFVRDYDGDLRDLSLTFSVARSAFGKSAEIDLVPGGRNREVTRANRVEYVCAMADYKLVRQIERQTAEFREGLCSVVGVDWLRLFDFRELQTLLSGAEGAVVDVDDLRRHAVVDGRGLFTTHRVVKWFWDVVAGLSPERLGLLLRFVTACSSPPLMGFGELRPPFTIRLVPLREAGRRQVGFLSRVFGKAPQAGQLPTAATCFNMLKLPLYGSKAALAEKLIKAIEAKAGFDLQ